jgi:hypothetical protein
MNSNHGASQNFRQTLAAEQGSFVLLALDFVLDFWHHGFQQFQKVVASFLFTVSQRPSSQLTRAKTSAHFVRSDGEKACRPFVGRYAGEEEILRS